MNNWPAPYRRYRTVLISFLLGLQLPFLCACNSKFGKGTGGSERVLTDSPTCQYNFDIPVRPLSSLTNSEFEYIFIDLGGDRSEIQELIKNWAPNSPTFHFRQLSPTEIYSQFAQDRIDGANLLAQAEFKRSELNTCFLSQYLPFAQKCFREYLSSRIQQLWRSSVSQSTIDQILDVYATNFNLADEYDQNDAHEEASMASLTAIFASPNFLFKSLPSRLNRSNQIYEFNSFELAERMAFAITQSLPDETLINLAINDELKSPDIYNFQVERLMGEPKNISRLALNFSSQWLDTKNQSKLNAEIPDSNLSFADFASETQLVFWELLKTNSKLTQLASPGFTYANQRLANHYELPFNSNSSSFIKISTDRRGGLFQQGTLYFEQGDIEETRPVARGIWVLDRILCSPIPLTDAATQEEILQSSERLRGLPVHERLARHRNQKQCNSCHYKIDPIGLGLENYNALAKWRMRYPNRRAIFSYGNFLGQDFKNSDQLSNVIAQSNAFESCVKKKIHSYITGSDPYITNSCAEVELHKTSNLKELFEASLKSKSFKSSRRKK